MIYIKTKYLPIVIILFIMIGIISQYLIPYSDYRNILTPTCFDALGLGALLSWVLTFKKELFDKFYWVLKICSTIALLIIVFAIVSHDLIGFLPIRTSMAIITTFIISYIIKIKKKSFIILFLLENKFLVFLGKISYGLYLIHYPLFYFSNKSFTYLNNKLAFSNVKYDSVLLFIENFSLLIAISWLSWKLIEQPILLLKRHFEFGKPNSGALMPIVKAPSVVN